MGSYYDEVDIEDMDYDEESETYFYPCPCGDRFFITLDDLRDGEEVAACPSCSLELKVSYDPDDFQWSDDDEEEEGGGVRTEPQDAEAEEVERGGEEKGEEEKRKGKREEVQEGVQEQGLQQLDQQPEPQRQDDVERKVESAGGGGTAAAPVKFLRELSLASGDDVAPLDAIPDEVAGAAGAVDAVSGTVLSRSAAFSADGTAPL